MVRVTWRSPRRPRVDPRISFGPRRTSLQRPGGNQVPGLGVLNGGVGTAHLIPRRCRSFAVTNRQPRQRPHIEALSTSHRNTSLIRGGRGGASELSAVVACRYRRDLEAVGVWALGEADGTSTRAADQHGADLSGPVRRDQTGATAPRRGSVECRGTRGVSPVAWPQDYRCVRSPPGSHGHRRRSAREVNGNGSRHGIGRHGR